MFRKYLLSVSIVSMCAVPSYEAVAAGRPDYDYLVNIASRYIVDSCVTTSGAIIMGRTMLSTFRGTPHYKICPYFSNFAAIALLDDPSPANLGVVKKWMKWVFEHLNKDGSIYDYFTDKLIGGGELPSIDAYPRERIPDYDSKDSYAATFLTLARKYVEVVPSDIPWLRGYSGQLQLMGNAIYSVIDDSSHRFSGDNNDGLTVAKPDYQVKYTMDNSETNEGLKDMVWLERKVIANGDPSYYQKLLDNNNDGFANLWDSTTSTYYSYEGSITADWKDFYPDGACQLYPIWTGVISPTSQRAIGIYHTFNLHYQGWEKGKYSGSLWTIICYAAAVMRDSSRVNSYLVYVQDLFRRGQYPRDWFNMSAAFIIRAARAVSEPSGMARPQSPIK